MLAEHLHWSLHDIDRTDIESLIPFVFHLAGTHQQTETRFCDQVDWL